MAPATPSLAFQGVTALRGLTALCICLWHFSTDGLFPPNHPIPLFFTYQPLHSYTFLIITGYVLTAAQQRRREAVGAFLKRRWVRLEPAFWGSLVLVLLLDYASGLSGQFRGRAFGAEPLLWATNLLHLNAAFGLRYLNPVYWTLAVEWQYYLLAAVLMPVLLRQPPQRLLWCLLAAGPLSWLWPHALSSLPRYLPFYGMGIALWAVAAGRLPRSTALGLIGGLGLLALPAFWQEWERLLGAVLTALLLGWGRFRWAAAEGLGRLSYALFLTHLPVGTRVLHLGERLWPQAPLAVLLGATAVSVGFAYVFYRWVEQPLATRLNHLLTPASDAK